MIAPAAENAAARGLNGTLVWGGGDAKAMSIEDGWFDVMAPNNSLHYGEDPLPVFDEIPRVPRAEGLCLVHDSRRLQTWTQ